VHETLDFAHQLTSVNYDPQRVEDAIALLGLEECRDTILGNALIRGVSGGQKKRVTIGELLVSDASTLFLDEFSNGLDSSTSTDIGTGLKKFCLKYNSSVVATLQQPTPELFELFDRIIILNEGQVLFDGPTCDVLSFFQGMGFQQPDDIDTSDFIIDCLSQPRSVILRQREEELFRQKQGKKARKKTPKEINTSYGPIKPSPTPCISTEEMIEYYHTTPFWKEIKEELDHKIPHLDATGHFEAMDLSKFAPLMPTGDSKTMYRLGYRLSIPTLLSRVIVRQAKIFARNTQTIIPRVFMAFFMSLIYGSLYYGIQPEEYVLRLSAFCIAVFQVASGNFVEMPISCQAVLVIKKQLAARFYPAWTYSVAALIMSVPMAFVDATVYSLFLYFMTNSYAKPAQFFTFWVLCLMCSLQLSTWFRFLATACGDEATAQSFSGSSTGVFSVFGGLFVSRSNIPDFMVWLYWISPFSWIVRALSNNEFLSPRYDALIEVSPGQFDRVGNVYLETIDIYAGSGWILWCCLYLIGLSLFLVFIDQFFITSKYYEESIGTRRSDEAEIVEGELDIEVVGSPQADNDDAILEEQVRAAALHQAEIQGETSNTGSTAQSSTAQSSTGTSHTGPSVRSSFNPNSLKTLRESLPFTPAWLSFSDVSYTVKVEKDKQMVDRILLNHVNGIAQPGRMLALMGASGAGKTTLLDVLAGLKNTGVVEGKILINGQPTTPELIATMTGYVEQFDTLFPFETVRETLDFAARLRLPHSISYEIKTKIVDEIIDILDLGSMSNFIIGNAKIQGLSPAQRKRVSIGVELVANPSILFLDEPTTGLDSKSAQTVIKVVKRIARSGRAVICTIHQPNSELFFMFDRLLLLGAGGFQIYYGDVGRRAKTFIDYLSRCPGVTPIQPRVNPASWMLVELGVGVASEKGDIEAGRANVAKRNDTFEVQDEPEWADMEPSKVTVQRFKTIYLQSDHYKLCEKRLRVLESIEIIDPTDSAGLERHRKEVEMTTVQRMQNKPNGARSTAAVAEDSTNASETTLPTTTILIKRATRPPWYIQLKLLYTRNFSAYYRNGSFIYARLIVMTSLSVLFGLIYLDLHAVDVASVSSLIGGYVFPFFASLLPFCSIFHSLISSRERFLFTRLAFDPSSISLPFSFNLQYLYGEYFQCNYPLYNCSPNVF
jgi:ABC-type multidrug transport system ATPase subunit